MFFVIEGNIDPVIDLLLPILRVGGNRKGERRNEAKK